MIVITTIFFSSFESSIAEEKIFYSTGISGAKWDRYEIPVCWENPTNEYENFMKITQSAIEQTWERYSYLKFIGWGKCSYNSSGIRIIIEDHNKDINGDGIIDGPHTKAIGKYLDGIKNGMSLNFSFNHWGTSCASDKENCVHHIAVHEFGHALGFAHEQIRSPSALCRGTHQGPVGNLYLTPYDLYSVMNYCNPAWNGNGMLSENDIKGLKIWYGSSHIPPHHISADMYYDLGVRFVDVDGDGLEDMLYHRFIPESSSGGWSSLSGSYRQIGVYKNTGNDWVKLSSAYNPPHHISADDHRDLGVRFVDVDGDGLKDMIYHRYISSGNKQIGAYKNTGKGWEKMSSAYNPPHHISSDDHADLGVRFVDVDGDGLEDLIYHRYISSGNKQIGAYKNTGYGWKKMDTAYNPPHHIAADGLGDIGVRFVDVDGDGLKDLIYHRYISSSNKQIGAYKNTGKGWQKMSSTYNPPHHISSDDHADIGVRFVDVDSDGLEDMIYHRYISSGNKQIGAYRNTGHGWKKMDAAYNPPHHIAADGYYDLGVRFIDVNGDGTQDLIANRYLENGSKQNAVFLNTGHGWSSE